MANTEDTIFWIYGRDRTSANCSCAATQGCDCGELVPVKPSISVGDRRVPMSFHRRSYARWDTTCPICLNPLLTASNTYITYCGHAFHRRCFVLVAEHQWSDGYLTKTKCPTCRAKQSVWDLSDGQYNTTSACDELENFWTTMADRRPRRCPMATTANTTAHDLGMCPTCPRCRHYWDHGS
jgi:hypothetical protein